MVRSLPNPRFYLLVGDKATSCDVAFCLLDRCEKSDLIRNVAIVNVIG